MNKCYWEQKYFKIDDVILTCFNISFYYGEDKTYIIDFESFDEFYEFAKQKKMYLCEPKISLIGNRYVQINGWGKTAIITEKKFPKITYYEQYREFNPTVEQAMHYLTVQQFKEYMGGDLFEKKY